MLQLLKGRKRMHPKLSIMKKIMYLVLIGGALAGIYYFINGTGAITVKLSAINDSGISGSAIISEQDGQLVVKMSLPNGIGGTVMPAHIHEGVCPGVGAVAYPLNPVTEGSSITIFESVKLVDLRAKKTLAINVHKSAGEMGTYVACGNIGL